MRTLYPTSLLTLGAASVGAWGADGTAAALAPTVLSAVSAIGLGVAFPALGYFGPAVGRVLGRADALALTFDDGPDPRHTPEVLRLLAGHGARATFFLVGERVLRHPGLAREVVAAGHEVALHSHTHDPLLALRGGMAVTRDFERGEAAFGEALGVRPTLFRPPAGVASPTVHRVARRRGYRVVAWSVRGLDGIRHDPARVRARVLARAAAGDVVLLHDRGVAALGGILEGLAARGLRPTTVSDLLAR